MDPTEATSVLTGASSTMPTSSASTGVDTSGDLATTMMLRGAVGCLVGAASSPKGNEAVWGVAGAVMGVLLGQAGIIAVAAAALWRKTV